MVCGDPTDRPRADADLPGEAPTQVCFVSATALLVHREQRRTAAQAYVYSSRQIRGRLVVEESAITSNSDTPERDTLTSQAGQAAANCHHDAVLGLATVGSSGGGRMLLSCSRDGVIKAWK